MKITKENFFDTDLEDIAAEFLPPGVKVTDLPILNSVDGVPVPSVSQRQVQKAVLEFVKPSAAYLLLGPAAYKIISKHSLFKKAT